MSMTWRTFWFIPAEARIFFSQSGWGQYSITLHCFRGIKETGAKQNICPLQTGSSKYDYITMIMKRVVYIYIDICICSEEHRFQNMRELYQ